MDAWREKFANWIKSLSTRQKILTGIVVASVVIAILYQIPGSGFGKDENESETRKGFLNPKDGKIIVFTEKTINHQPGKTLWDWLQLSSVIAIPFALLYFQQTEQKRSEKRVETEKKIADSNLREQALETYFYQVSEKLTFIKTLDESEKRVLYNDDEIHEREAAINAVHARTLSILRRLDQDEDRKRYVISFLVDAGVRWIKLDNADLRKVNLSNLNFLGFSFINAILKEADLTNADLRRAILKEAFLSGANLEGANLEEAYLRGAKNLTIEQIKNAHLWDKAIYDEEFRAKLGLAPDPPPTSET